MGDMSGCLSLLNHCATFLKSLFGTSTPSLKSLLHGSLDVCISEATNLPSLDTLSDSLNEGLQVLPTGILNDALHGVLPTSNLNEALHGVLPTLGPYVSISVAGATVGRTFVAKNSENPLWKQHLFVLVAHHAADVRFIVKYNDVMRSQLIGSVSIPAQEIYTGEKIEGRFPVLNSSGSPVKNGASLSLSIQYIPIEKQSIYQLGVESAPDYRGVPGTYFPLRRGEKVTLYQDAHVPDGNLPNLELDGGIAYEHGKCWREIFDAISQAQRLIYITGWSLYHKVALVRDGGLDSLVSLGDLLKAKSREGVRVLLLVWNDPTSTRILGLQTTGSMDTHDKEIFQNFKDSSVKVLLCPRTAGKKQSWLRQQETVFYQHHQKTVIVDSDAGNDHRKIIAFVGGLDLCQGRYDTPEHPIFRTLQTVHKDDYYNPNFKRTIVGGRREPWHDLHCKIDGQAAYDVLTNFVECWLKASKPREIMVWKPLTKLKTKSKMKFRAKVKRTSHADLLLKIDRVSDKTGVKDTPETNESEPETWNVQVFRSLDSNSVKGFPKDPKKVSEKNLVYGENVVVDESIHSAYVYAIRASEHFIYIENECFLGSSFNWSSENDISMHHHPI